jgi:hypothetical protein
LLEFPIFKSANSEIAIRVLFIFFIDLNPIEVRQDDSFRQFAFAKNVTPQRNLATARSSG